MQIREEEEERKTAAHRDKAEEEEEEKKGAPAEGVGDKDEDWRNKVGADNDDEDAAGMKKTKQRMTSCPDRKCVPGILYLGHIPPRLRPKHLRNLLSVYGEIGRIFLQPEGTVYWYLYILIQLYSYV